MPANNLTTKEKEMPPLISVVLCTHNNADSLELTLKEISNQVLSSPELIEVVVVNNNSTDHTEQVVQPFLSCTRIHFRYIVESKQGLSNARNTGVSNARGDYILFTDDDAAIPNSWITIYLQEIRRDNPDCVYGKIEIIWDRPQPWWYIPEYKPCFVGLDYGNSRLEVTDIHHEFYGKNFCVRKSLIIKYGGFDPNLGRQKNKLAAGEETLIYRQLISEGRKVIYSPQASVGHRLKEREYSTENIKKLFIDGAYSSHHISKLTSRRTIFRRPARAFIDSIRSLFRSLILISIEMVRRDRARIYYHYLCICRNTTFLRIWIKHE